MKTVTLFLVGLIAFAFLAQPASLSFSQEKEDLKYVGASKCKMCHNKADGKFYDDWAAGPHAKAFLLLKGEERKNAKCLKCHTTGYGKAGGFTALEGDNPAEADMVKALAGVQCEVCHGPGEKHITSKKDKVVPHSIKPEEKVCKTCHNEENPNWKADRYTTKDGKKVGFDFAQAVLKVKHDGVKKK